MPAASTDQRGEPIALGEFNGHEVYPMPMFAKIIVGEVDGVTKWYEDALGFKTVFRAPSPAGGAALVHLRRRKYQDILLVSAGDAEIKAGTLQLSFNADGEVDALYERAHSVAPAGASSVRKPVDTPWNTRDLQVTDPAGTSLVFTGRQPNPNPAQVKRWQDAFKKPQL